MGFFVHLASMQEGWSKKVVGLITMWSLLVFPPGILASTNSPKTCMWGKWETLTWVRMDCLISPCGEGVYFLLDSFINIFCFLVDMSNRRWRLDQRVTLPLAYNSQESRQQHPVTLSSEFDNGWMAEWLVPSPHSDFSFCVCPGCSGFLPQSKTSPQTHVCLSLWPLTSDL